MFPKVETNIADKSNKLSQVFIICNELGSDEGIDEKVI